MQVCGPQLSEFETKRFLRDLTAKKGSEGRRNNNILMLSCQKPLFVLCQVCQPDDEQTNFKMLVPWIEFWLFRAMLCWDIFPELTR